MNEPKNNSEFPPLSGSGSQEQTCASKVNPKIEGYRILEEIGEGGMGVVYLAEQLKSVRRRVALKVIKPGMDSSQVIARFETERQALALMDHTNVAQVFDAGTTEAEHPYFVMEYVKGYSITEHCDREKYSIEQRLKLFMQVCHAVQHAHQKGIIHRDIKPSNILIMLQGEQAVPKIIDFGVAKAINQPLTERTLFTEQGQLIGTPEYMSPEQAEMSGKDIDTRSDIYSLGVLLYELLTGALPFDRKTLREAAFAEIQRIIREEDPPRPSTRLPDLGDKAGTVAQSRRTEVASLTKRLQKELEWIPLKAMRKERSARYSSASDLADDIQNYLTGAPLIAGPESSGYRFKKFVRRNRTLVIGAAAVLVVLIAGIIVSSIFAVGQARARKEENQQRQIAEAERDQARIAKQQAEKSHIEAETARDQAVNAENEARLANKKLNNENYAATMGITQMLIEDRRYSRASELLEECPVEVRGWEWGRLQRWNSPELLTIRPNEHDDRPPGSLHNALFTPDGKYIIDDGPGMQQYSVIDLHTGETVLISKQYHGGGWRDCTQFIAEAGLMSYSSGRHSVDIVDYRIDETLIQFDSGKGTLRSFVVSPNGELAAGFNIVEPNGMREIILWDASTGQELKRFPMETLDPTLIQQYTIETEEHQHTNAKGWWLARLISPRGKVLGFLADNGRIVFADEQLSVLDIETGQRRHLAPCSGWLASYTSKSNWAAIYSSSGMVEIWDTDKGKKLSEFQLPYLWIDILSISGDGKWVAVSSEDTWYLWRSDTGELVRTFPDLVVSINFDSSDTLIVTTNLGEIKVWSILNERNVQVKCFTSADHEPFSLQNVGLLNSIYKYDHQVDHLAMADFAGNLYILQVPSFRLHKQWKAHPDLITSVAFNPEADLLATTSVDGTAKVWKTETGGLVHTITGVAGKLSKGVSFSHDGKRLALGADIQDESETAETDRYEVRIYDVETGEYLFSAAQGQFSIDELAYSPDGKWLAAGRGYGSGIAGNVTIYDAETIRRSYGEIPDTGETRGLSFSPDGRYLLALGMQLELVLWDLEEPREVWRLKNKAALQAEFHPDSRRFFVINLGKTTIHSTEDGRELINLGEIQYSPASFSKNGRLFISRRDEDHMSIFQCDDWTVVDNNAAYTDALDEIQQELDYAKLFREDGQYNLTENQYVTGLEELRGELGVGHPFTLFCMNNLAKLLQSQGRFAEAEELFIEALKIQRRELADDHPFLDKARENLIRLYYEWDRPGQAGYDDKTRPVDFEFIKISLAQRLPEEEYPSIFNQAASLELKRALTADNPQFVGDVKCQLNEGKIVEVDISGTGVSNINFLKGLELTRLDISDTNVSDISMLKDMPLKYLDLSHSPVANLNVLAEIPLKYLIVPDVKTETSSLYGNINTSCSIYTPGNKPAWLMNFSPEFIVKRGDQYVVKELCSDWSDGIIHGAVSAGDKIGALAFDGTNDHVVLNSASLNHVPNWTWTGWIYPTQKYYQTLYSEGHSYTTFAIELEISTGKLIIGILNDKSPDEQWCETNIKQNAISLNTWNFVTITLRDGGPEKGELSLFINGQYLSSTPSQMQVHNETKYAEIGGNIEVYFGADIKSFPFKGRIAEIAIYYQVLTPEEIQNIYSEKAAFFTLGKGNGRNIDAKFDFFEIN